MRRAEFLGGRGVYVEPVLFVNFLPLPIYLHKINWNGLAGCSALLPNHNGSQYGEFVVVTIERNMSQDSIEHACGFFTVWVHQSSQLFVCHRLAIHSAANKDKPRLNRPVRVLRRWIELTHDFLLRWPGRSRVEASRKCWIIIYCAKQEMGTPALITLEFLWGFLSPVFGEKLKETLRKKDSSDLAKERVYALYKSLGDLKARNFAFINALMLCASLIDERAQQESTNEAKGFLYDRTDELMAASAQMVDALESLYPQLEIHHYDLYEEIVYYKQTREMYGGTSLGDELAGALFNAEEGNPQELNSILAQEEKLYQSIDRCLRDFRIFIVKEIPFGSSF